MRPFKSLLLASFTGLIMASGANAADLGVKKPSPVEYVRACYNPLWGTSGGFIIPGTQTCLRVFGQARFDIGYGQPFNRALTSPMGYRGGMTIGLDAITPSEYGNVRAFAAIGAMYRTGQQFSGSLQRQGFAISDALPAGQNSRGQTEINYTGFIQFAGFTMGRTASFFRTVGRPNEIIGTTWLSDPGNVNTIAYTAQLGNGFLATIALEDPTTRRFGVLRDAVFNAAGNVVLFSGNMGPLIGVGGSFVQVGNRMPTAIASLRVDQAWGSAELSALVKEVGLVGAIGGVGPSTGLFFSPGTKYGFAINGGVKINLPMLAPGSNLTFNAVYSEGAMTAIMSNGGNFPNNAIAFGGVSALTPDAMFNQGNGRLSLVKAWSVTAGLQHFWTPTLNSSLFGSYARATGTGRPGDFLDYNREFTLMTFGLNTIWSPVRGLSFGLETVYQQMKTTRQIDVNRHTSTAGNVLLGPCVFATGVNCFLKSSDGAFQARLKVTRDF